MKDQILQLPHPILLACILTRIFVRRQGINLDLTDDRIDPRKGFRFKFENYGFEGEGLTNYRVEDYSFTSYIPNSNLDSVLVANIFYSSSTVINSLGKESVVAKSSLVDTKAPPNVFPSLTLFGCPDIKR